MAGGGEIRNEEEIADLMQQELGNGSIVIKPDAVAEGHKPLRHIALIRQGKGGKKPSITERLKRGRGKTALEQMLNAEFLLAKDPDNLQYAEAMMKAALEGGYKQSTEWIADLIFQAYRASDNAPAQAFVQLKDAYAAVGLFEKAIAACQYAAKLRPDDDELKDELRDLSAQFTVQRGRYGQEGDFRDSIKDREEQARLQAQAAVVKTRDYRLAVVAEAREAFAQNPHLATNIFTLADALADLAEDKSENEAIELLEKTYSTTRDFSFKRHSGELRLKQFRRKGTDVRDKVFVPGSFHQPAADAQLRFFGRTNWSRYVVGLGIGQPIIERVSSLECQFSVGISSQLNQPLGCFHCRDPPKAFKSSLVFIAGPICQDTQVDRMSEATEVCARGGSLAPKFVRPVR